MLIFNFFNTWIEFVFCDKPHIHTNITDINLVMELYDRVTWALTIYRQTIEAGVLPTVEILSQLLGCLRKPEASTTPVSIFDDKAAAFLGQSQPATSTSFDGFGIYDPRALALFEVPFLPSLHFHINTS